jgi:NAD+ synthase (glutamine-hydrolysing)
VRLALCQIDTTVGDFAGNAVRILDGLSRAEKVDADLAVFPELAICGYPPRDLLERPSFAREAARSLAFLARRARRTALLVGTIAPNRSRVGKPFHNVSALLEGGRVRVLAKKTLLPTYDVFDEGRWFEPGDGCVVLPFRGERLGLPVCEDLWNDKDFWRERRLYRDDPGEALLRRGATLVVAISASPFSEGKPHLRRRMLARYARDGRVPVAHLNLVGGNDELVFDGGSMVLDGRGRVAARAALFEEDFVVADIVRDGRGVARVVPVPGDQARDLADDADGDPLESLRRALVLGIRDYASKCGFKTAVLGLSGGIDSALVAALAVEALGKGNVTGLAMPSPYSSEGSIADARDLARNLAIRFDVLPIGPLFEGARRTLAPLFKGLPEDVTEENVQSRLRGLLVMAVSNKKGPLVLTTGNKSELAVGYCTLYGDMCGGLAPISDLPKMRVYALARHLNARAGRPLIPEASLVKAPSAELRPGQTDQDSLPPYPRLDAILESLVERNLSVEAAARRTGAPLALVKKIARQVDRAEYKRNQAAPGLKVSAKAFGSGRRIPIAQRAPL